MNEEIPRTPKLWQQQPGEPGRWYNRFHRFLLLGVSRSLLCLFNAEQVEKGRKKAGDVPGAWRNAAEKWHWRERAAAWDAFQQEREEEEWHIRRREQREFEWQASQQLFKKAEQMLDQPLDNGKWSFRDAAACLEVASKLARTAGEMHQGDLNAAIAYIRKFGYTIVDNYQQVNDESE